MRVCLFRHTCISSLYIFTRWREHRGGAHGLIHKRYYIKYIFGCQYFAEVFCPFSFQHILSPAAYQITDAHRAASVILPLNGSRAILFKIYAVRGLIIPAVIQTRGFNYRFSLSAESSCFCRILISRRIRSRSADRSAGRRRGSRCERVRRHRFRTG